MNRTQVIEFIFQAPGKDVIATDADVERAKVYADRLILRLFNAPALIARLKNVNMDGLFVELEFVDIPDQAVVAVQNLGGIDPKNSQVLRYERDGIPYVGFRIYASE